MLHSNSRRVLIASILTAIILISLFAPVSGGTADSAGQGANKVSVFINFKHQPGPAEAALVRAAGGDVSTVFRIIPSIVATIPEPAVFALSNNPNVTLVEPNRTLQLLDAELDAAWSVKHIGAGTVHNSGNKGAGVRVAVIDSGIDLDHEDLSYDPGCSANFSTENTLQDGHSHGSHVAGTVAARDNGLGVVGVAPEATLCVIKVFDSSGNTTWEQVIQGLEYIMDYNTANPGDPILVTNNSIGDWASTAPSELKTVYDVLYYQYGVFHAAAAGNNGISPECFVPAMYNSVVAVGGTTGNDTWWDIASACPEVELSAPGFNVYSTWNGESLLPPWLPPTYYGQKSGTSMSTPHVAGTAALIISAGITDLNGNGFINDEVRQRLIDSAIDLENPGWDSKTGYGRVDAVAAAQSDNTPPVANNVSDTTAEDTLDTWLPDVSDADAGDTPTCTADPTSSNGGSVMVTSDCSIGTYDPPADYNGPDSFSYYVSDGSLSDPGTVSYQVTAVDDPPVANNVSESTDEDTLDNWVPDYSEVDGDPVTCTADPASLNGGTVTVAGDCSGGTYDPPADYNGPDSISYLVSDGTSSDPATVSYQVNPVNDQPVANNVSEIADEDTLDNWLPDIDDVDIGDTLTCTADPTSSNGGAVMVASDCSSGTYDPPADYNGSDSFSYSVSDGSLSDPGTVSYQVSAVDDPPVANNVNDSTDEDTLDNWLPDYSEVDGDSVTCTADPASLNGGTVTVAGDCSGGSYTPLAGYNGPDSFTYSVSDGTSSDEATVSYQVNAVNNPPVANNVSDSTAEDTLDTWYPDVDDVDVGDNLACSADAFSSNGGTVTVASDCSSGTYDPPADYNGSDSFSYTVSDGSLSDPATVSYQVTAVNDQPVANDVSDSTAENTQLSWLPDVSDVDIGDNLTCSADALSSNGGTVTVASNCSSGTYDPPPGFTDQDSFSYSVSDGALNDSALVTIVVVGGDDVASSDFATAEGIVEPGTFLATQTQDDIYQVLIEAHTGGKPVNRHDELDHIWAFNLSGGNHVFEIDAYYVDAGDGDSGFEFQWSASSGGPWTYLLSVNKSSDDDSYQVIDLGGGLPATIYIRVADTDQTAGHNNNDTLYVDHMRITGGGPVTDPPGQATNPSPADGATGIGLSPTLNWSAGMNATSHDVFFGTTSGSLVYQGNQASTSFTPGTLDPGTTYYWRIDEANSSGTTTGIEWSFTTSSDVAESSRVESITLNTLRGNAGAKHGRATVVVVDNLGNFVVGVTVFGTFTFTVDTGEFEESVTGDTDGGGTAVLTTTYQAKKSTFTFCVDSISGALPYNPIVPDCASN